MKGLLLAGSAFALLGAPVAWAATNTYNVTTTWYEPATAPRDSIFIGSFDYDDTTHVVTNLRGILSESMTGDPIAYDPIAGAGNSDNMVWLALDSQLVSWHDATLQGTFAASFLNTSTNTFTSMLGGDGWSPQSGVDNMGIFYGFPKASNNPGNAYALIFVPDSLSAINTASNPLTLSWREGTPELDDDGSFVRWITPGSGDLGLAYTAYADCVPTAPGGMEDGGGMMGAVCMTGTSYNAYGAIGTMGGVPYSQSITAAVPEPESYALMLAGIGLMNVVVRRRKTDRAAARKQTFTLTCLLKE